jgi:hypothetical protein
MGSVTSVAKLIMTVGIAAGATAAGALASGCAFFGGGSVTDKAKHAERVQCEAATAQDDLRIVQMTPVLDVEGRYSSHESGIAKVTATRIVLRPPQGVSADRMTRILQCHNARVVLGRADASSLPNDPYALPDTWIDIDVKEEEGNYVAVISADTVSNNLRVLRRAQAFAAAQRSAGPAPPM